jgi:heme o synthase
MNTRVDAETRFGGLSPKLSALVQLTKPGVTRLVFVTTLLGAALAPGSIDRTALFTVLGTLLVVASANSLNMYLEYDVDALMERTRTRPLPTGALSRRTALIFGCALGLTGLVLLLTTVNGLTAFLGAFSLVTYVLFYTPMKARSSLALYVGAVPGAMPPVMGYTGLSGVLTTEAIALFLVLFVWQIPHFLAISIFRRDEYARAGLKVMSVEYSLESTERAIVWSSLVLLLVSLVPWAVGLGGTPYLIVALICGILFTGWAARGHAERTIEQWARTVFFASLPYIVALFATLALSA